VPSDSGKRSSTLRPVDVLPTPVGLQIDEGYQTGVKSEDDALMSVDTLCKSQLSPVAFSVIHSPYQWLLFRLTTALFQRWSALESYPSQRLAVIL
jgi:hypothetical protein